MLKLQIISFFLCSLLLVQIIPLQQIGNAFSQSQWTEELPHGEDSASECFDNNFLNHHFLPPYDYVEIINKHVVNIDLSYIHSSQSIPQNHCGDIESPPPDFLV